VDIALTLPNGSRSRGRKRGSHFSKSTARRWAADRERHLLQHGPPTSESEVPTLEAFAPRFIEGHAQANRHKPSGIAAHESILKWHLVPLLGAKRLDGITNEQVQKVKLALADRAPKTVNNVLTLLRIMCMRPTNTGRPAHDGWLRFLIDDCGREITVRHVPSGDRPQSIPNPLVVVRAVGDREWGSAAVADPADRSPQFRPRHSDPRVRLGPQSRESPS
jgi:hypothetical protein